MKTLIALFAALTFVAALPREAPADTLPAAVQALVDEAAIRQAPAEIEIAVDRKDWARARSFFADQIRVDFSTLSGQAPATIPADALIAAWAANLGPKKQSHHQRGRGLVTIDGDKAVIVSQGYAWNRMEGNGEPLWEVWGTYTHTLERTAAGWKVTGMTFAMTHQRGNFWVRDTPSPKE